MSTLALLGGDRAVPAGVTEPPWPIVTDDDEKAVARVLRGGRLAATVDDEPEVTGLESEWAAWIGVRHCVGVSSGTAALQLALAALGVGPGQTVAVPALSMNATALAVLARGATPVFTDIDPATYTMDPGSLEAVITPDTTVVLPVHLHGLPAAMDQITAIARRHGAAVVEDAAQAHGATFNGMPTGALGTAGCFSMHPSKNLPTCGEGGLLTTASAEVDAAARRLRLFGERLKPGGVRTYVAHDAGANYKLSPVQAAFARSQLDRFETYARGREPGIRALLGRLAALPGLRPPVVPPGMTHAWHILRFRIVAAELDMAGIPAGVVRRALHRVLRAEGVPVSRYQVAPLPEHPAFAPSGPAGESFPVTSAVLADSLCLQRRHLNPGAGDLLARYADAFEKVWANLDVVRQVARNDAARVA